MKRGAKNIANYTLYHVRWAFFSLFFCFLLICIAFGWHQRARAEISSPIASPPEHNASGNLLIDGSAQAKQGSLRFGTSDVVSPFNYQLEVLGEGAQSTAAEVEKNLQVGKTSSTLYVDADNSCVCIGPCLGVSGSKLEVTGGTWSINAPNTDALSATSSSAEALYGSSVYPSVGPGVQGTSASDTGYGVKASNLTGTGVQGESGTDLPFAQVLLFNDSIWYNRTNEAASTAQNDVFGGNLMGIFSNIDSAIYFGHTSPFNRIYIDSTPYNSTGTVVWEYCSAKNTTTNVCTTWTAVAPYSGAFHFNINYPSVTTVALWDAGVPADMTNPSVNGSSNLYYIRARTTVAYTRITTQTPALERTVGSQFLPGTMSSVYGYSQTGYGIYASNTNPFGLWTGYFDGRVEGSRDVSGSKLVKTSLSDSLVARTAGQVVDQYFKNYYPYRLAADNSYLYVGQEATLVNGTWYGSEVLKVDKASGKVVLEYDSGFAHDLVYDSANGYLWQSYGGGDRGRIYRINVNTNEVLQRDIFANGFGTCGNVNIVRADANYLWVLQHGAQGTSTCFGQNYFDRLLRFNINTISSDPWVPDLQLDIDHNDVNNVVASPTSITYDGTSIWVSFKDNNQVYKINAANPDPNGDNILSSTEYSAYSIPGPTDLSYDATNGVIWASSDQSSSSVDGAYSISSTTGTVAGPVLQTPAGWSGSWGPQAITFGGSDVWVGTNIFSSTGLVDRFNAGAGIANPSTVSVTGIQIGYCSDLKYVNQAECELNAKTWTSAGHGRTQNDILYDSAANAVWVVSAATKSIARLNATSGAFQSVFDYSLKNLSVKKFDGTYLWMFDGSYLWKVRAADGFKVWQKSLGAGVNPTDVMFDGNNVWVTISGTANQVLKINPANGDTLCPVNLAANVHPQSIVFDGLYYWVLTSGTNTGDVAQVNSTCGTVATKHLTDASDALTKLVYDGSYLWALSPSEGYVYMVNPSNLLSVYWSGLISAGATDFYYDNYYYWIFDQSSDTARRFYLSQNRVCSNDPGVSCTLDSECIAGSCSFVRPSAMFDNGGLGFGTGGNPTYAAFDGTYLWIANTGDSSQMPAQPPSLTRLNTALPADRTDFELGNIPTGIVFDGTYIYVSLSENGVLKIFSGSGFGSTDMSRTLTLQGNDVSIPQSGSVNLAGSARVGTTMTVGGDFISTSNAWPTIGSSDVMINPSDTTWTQTGALTGATTLLTLLESQSGTIVAMANSGYVFRSVDAGLSWTRTGLAGTAVGTSMTRSGSRFIAGVEVSGGVSVQTSTDDAVSWTASGTTLPGGLLFDNLFSAQNGNVYASSRWQMHSPYFAYIFRSSDGGATWNTTPVATISTATNAVAVSAFTELANGTLFAGLTTGEMYQSVDFGSNWSLLTTLSPAEAIRTLFRANNGYMYAGTSVGSVFRSTDFGATWVRTALASTTEVKSFIQSGSNLYAVASGGNVFRSADSGGSWQLIATITGTPQLTTLLLSSRSYLFTGTATGLVFQSGLGELGAGTKRCPAGHYISNITTNAAGRVVRIDCRGM